MSGFHSHLNGYEFIRVHAPHLWNDIYAIVRDVSAKECISTRGTHPRYSTSQLQRRMGRCLIGYGWEHTGARSRIRTKFVKNRVAVNVGFGKEPLGPYGFLTITSANMPVMSLMSALKFFQRNA